MLPAYIEAVEREGCCVGISSVSQLIGKWWKFEEKTAVTEKTSAKANEIGSQLITIPMYYYCTCVKLKLRSLLLLAKIPIRRKPVLDLGITEYLR